MKYNMTQCENYETCAALHDWTNHSGREFICNPAECNNFLLKKEFKQVEDREFVRELIIEQHSNG